MYSSGQLQAERNQIKQIILMVINTVIAVSLTCIFGVRFVYQMHHEEHVVGEVVLALHVRVEPVRDLTRAENILTLYTF